jgi:CubicO group peptidase (beta-lactamase class C family)
MNYFLTATDNPEKYGVSASRLTRINHFLQGCVDCGDFAGISATIARQGETVYYEKFGYADIATQRPIAADTIFKIASMTKPITAVAAMMLYEEGHFQLNTPVADFIPGFKDTAVFAGPGHNPDEMYFTDLETPITFRHLFTHTSGLSYGWNENDPVDRRYQRVQQENQESGVPMTNSMLAKQLPKLPLAFQPGTHWRYSLSIDVIGALVEIISRKPFEQFLQEKIFDPLGMVDTNFYVPEDQQDRVATVYGRPNGATKMQAKAEIKSANQMPAFTSGGGGLVSTIGDYARFCQMLVNGGELAGQRLLSPKTVEMFTINHCPKPALPFGFEPGSLYHAGYGYSLGTRVLMNISQSGQAGSVGEFGWDGAFRTYFWIDPIENLYGILMVQHTVTPEENFTFHPQFKQLAYQALK